MKLHEVQPGQSFILLRTGRQYTHHGRHPKKWWVLTAPYSPIPHECKKLHISCDVEIVGQSNKNTGKHKRGCYNRSRTALSTPMILRDGYTSDGRIRYTNVRTEWKGFRQGTCQFALTPESQGDDGCNGCIWRRP